MGEKYWPIELKGFPNLTRDSGEPLIEKSYGGLARGHRAGDGTVEIKNVDFAPAP